MFLFITVKEYFLMILCFTVWVSLYSLGKNALIAKLENKTVQLMSEAFVQ